MSKETYSIPIYENGIKTEWTCSTSVNRNAVIKQNL